MDVLVAVAGPLDDLRAGQFRHRHLHRDRPQPPVSPMLDRRYRSVSPPTCSTNVLRAQLPRSQKNRRTRSRTMTRRSPNGRSSSVRWYELCTRLACLRRPGHRPGRPMDTTSTTRVSEEALTHSTRTSIPGTAHLQPRCLPRQETPCRNDPPFPSPTWGFTELRPEPGWLSASQSAPGVCGLCQVAGMARAAAWRRVR
jgi:hypothetical protein